MGKVGAPKGGGVGYLVRKSDNDDVIYERSLVFWWDRASRRRRRRRENGNTFRPQVWLVAALFIAQYACTLHVVLSAYDKLFSGTVHKRCQLLVTKQAQKTFPPPASAGVVTTHNYIFGLCYRFCVVPLLTQHMYRLLTNLTPIPVLLTSFLNGP